MKTSMTWPFAWLPRGKVRPVCPLMGLPSRVQRYVTVGSSPSGSLIVACAVSSSVTLGLDGAIETVEIEGGRFALLPPPHAAIAQLTSSALHVGATLVLNITSPRLAGAATFVFCRVADPH